MTDLIKQAEENVVKIAAAWEDAMKMVDALQKFGNKTCNEYIGRDEFFEGIYKLRNAMYREYTKALSECFIFVGVGGKKAIEYSREKFKETFNEEERTFVMSFLEKYGQIPSRWSKDVEDEFRRQAQEALNKK